jgi:acyl dehydratase
MFLADEAAKALGWEAQLVPGLLSYSIAVGLMIQSGFIADVKAYMSTDKMRFLAPVYPGDTIRVEAEVLSKKLIKSGDWICSYKWAIKNQHDKTTGEGENT